VLVVGHQSKEDVSVLSITIMKPNVISIEMDKKGVFAHKYQEGQYVFVLCPAISLHQWHPFTISSGSVFFVFDNDVAVFAVISVQHSCDSFF
jgi:hypothetical protein